MYLWLQNCSCHWCTSIHHGNRNSVVHELSVTSGIDSETRRNSRQGQTHSPRSHCTSGIHCPFQPRNRPCRNPRTALAQSQQLSEIWHRDTTISSTVTHDSRITSTKNMSCGAGTPRSAPRQLPPPTQPRWLPLGVVRGERVPEGSALMVLETAPRLFERGSS